MAAVIWSDRARPEARIICIEGRSWRSVASVYADRPACEVQACRPLVRADRGSAHGDVVSNRRSWKHSDTSAPVTCRLRGSAVLDLIAQRIDKRKVDEVLCAGYDGSRTFG